MNEAIEYCVQDARQCYHDLAVCVPRDKDVPALIQKLAELMTEYSKFVAAYYGLRKQDADEIALEVITGRRSLQHETLL